MNPLVEKQGYVTIPLDKYVELTDKIDNFKFKYQYKLFYKNN